LALGWIMYHGDNHDMLVPNYITSGPPADLSTRESWVTGNARLAATNGIRGGALFHYIGNERVYHCPLDRYRWQGEGGLQQLLWNYGLSPVMRGGKDGKRDKDWSRLVLVKASEIRCPALRFIFADKDAKDAHQDGGTGWLSLYTAGWDIWDTLPANRDGQGGINIIFADGHVESHAWKHWPKQRGACVNPRDAADLHWLQERYVEPDA
jgi:prepilin-type processing-associated H-X9-DG protein